MTDAQLEMERASNALWMAVRPAGAAVDKIAYAVAVVEDAMTVLVESSEAVSKDFSAAAWKVADQFKAESSLLLSDAKALKKRLCLIIQKLGDVEVDV